MDCPWPHAMLCPASGKIKPFLQKLQRDRPVLSVSSLHYQPSLLVARLEDPCVILHFPFSDGFKIRNISGDKRVSIEPGDI